MAWVPSIPAICLLTLAQGLLFWTSLRALRPLRRRAAWTEFVRDHPRIVEVANLYGRAVSRLDRPIQGREALRAWITAGAMLSGPFSVEYHFTKEDARAIRRAMR